MGGRREPDLCEHTDASGSQAKRRLQHETNTDAVCVKDVNSGETSWSPVASGALHFDLKQCKAGGLPW